MLILVISCGRDLVRRWRSQLVTRNQPLEYTFRDWVLKFIFIIAVFVFIYLQISHAPFLSVYLTKML